MNDVQGDNINWISEQKRSHAVAPQEHNLDKHTYCIHRLDNIEDYWQAKCLIDDVRSHQLTRRGDQYEIITIMLRLQVIKRCWNLCQLWILYNFVVLSLHTLTPIKYSVNLVAKVRYCMECSCTLHICRILFYSLEVLIQQKRSTVHSI